MDSILAIVCLLIGAVGAGVGIVYSQEGARSEEFAAGIMCISSAWAGALFYLAYKLLVF